MQITKLRIKNFRSIKDSGYIDLTKLYVLIGKNNTGKSAVLKAILMAWGNVKYDLRDFHKDTPDDIEIEVFLSGYNDEKYSEFFQEKGKPEKEEVCLKLVISKESGEKFFLDGEVKPKTITKKLPALLSISDIRDPESETTAGAKSFSKQLIGIIESQGKFKSEKEKAVASIRKIIVEDVGTISQITTKKFQNILNNKWEISITPEIDIAKAITYDTDLIIDKANRVKLLSSGTGIQSIFILALLEAYAEMVQSDDSILLIEEPEVYLHPELQRRMFDAMRLIANSNQVIFTTHSPIMISEIWIEDSIRLAKLENGETKFDRINIDDIINELGIKYEDVLNPKVVVFVEGPGDVRFYKRVVSIIKPELNEQQRERRIKFIDSDGWRNIGAYASMKIINSDRVKNSFYIIKDGDGRDVEERKNSLMMEIKKRVGEVIKKEDGLEFKERISVLSCYSIESYFMNADLITKVFPDLKKENVVYMITQYVKKYGEVIEELKKCNFETNKYKQFQTYLQPKNFFTHNRLRHERAKKKFGEIFQNDQTFLETRELLAKKCDELEGDYIDAFLDKISDKSIILEPLNIITKILKDTEK